MTCHCTCKCASARENANNTALPATPGGAPLTAERWESNRILPPDGPERIEARVRLAATTVDGVTTRFWVRTDGPIEFVPKGDVATPPTVAVPGKTGDYLALDGIGRVDAIIAEEGIALVGAREGLRPDDEHTWTYRQAVMFFRDAEKTAYLEDAKAFFTSRSEEEVACLLSWMCENEECPTPRDVHRSSYLLEEASERVLGVDGQGFRPGAMVTGREMQLYLGLFARLVREMAECEDRRKAEGIRRAWTLLREMVRMPREVKKAPEPAPKPNHAAALFEMGERELRGDYAGADRAWETRGNTATGRGRGEPEAQNLPPRGSVKAMTETCRIPSAAPNQANSPQATPKDPALTWEISHVGAAPKVDHVSGKMYPVDEGPIGHWIVLQHRGADGRRTRAMLRAEDIWFMGPEREGEQAESPFMPRPEPQAPEGLKCSFGAPLDGIGPTDFFSMLGDTETRLLEKWLLGEESRATHWSEEAATDLLHAVAKQTMNMTAVHRDQTGKEDPLLYLGLMTLLVQEVSDGDSGHHARKAWCCLQDMAGCEALQGETKLPGSHAGDVEALPEPLEVVRDRLGELYQKLGVSTHAGALARIDRLEVLST